MSIRDIFFANDFKNVSFLVTRFEGDENTARLTTVRSEGMT